MLKSLLQKERELGLLDSGTWMHGCERINYSGDSIEHSEDFH